MKTLIVFLIFNILAGLAMAGINIIATSDSNTVTISYSGSDSNNLISGFSLDISTDSNDLARISYVNGISTDYYFYPHSIMINSDGTVSDYGSCLVDASTESANQKGITVEMSSLYKGETNEPGTSGDLATFKVSNNCTVTIVANDARGGIVLEDATTTQDVNFFGTEVVFLPPREASSPIPFDGSTTVFEIDSLNWQATNYADSFDIYLGTNFNDVNTASNPYISPGKGNQTSSTYVPASLNSNTTYYWRIDTKNTFGTTKGSVWSFTTKNSSTLFIDSFEENFSHWTDGGNTNWIRTNSRSSDGYYSSQCRPDTNDLTSDNIDTFDCNSITIFFMYRDRNINANDAIYLELYDGANYDYRSTIDAATENENTWQQFQETINNSGADSQYFHSNFRIRFSKVSLAEEQGKYLWIDDIVITKQ